MSLMSVSKPNQLITVDYLVNELINQLINGGPDKEVILRAYNTINHLEPIEEYFPIETNSNKVLIGGEEGNTLYLINNPFLESELKTIKNWNNLIFENYLKVKENSDLNLNKLNLINYIYNLNQYMRILKGEKLSKQAQLTKEWSEIFKFKNLRFNLLLNPKRNNKYNQPLENYFYSINDCFRPHTLTLKLNEILEEIRIIELKEQLKVKSDNVKFLGRTLSKSILTVINYSKYSPKICNLNLDLLKSYSTRLPLKWIDKDFNESLKILFNNLPHEKNFKPDQLIPILELWSVWSRRIGELTDTEINSYSTESNQISLKIQNYLNSNFKKSKETLELSLMIIVILTDIFKSSELLTKSELLVNDGLMMKDENERPLLYQSQYIHPTFSTLLKYLPKLTQSNKLIENYLKLQNYEYNIDNNLNTMGSLMFICSNLIKEGVSNKVITNGLLDPILDMIKEFNYDTNKNSNFISPLFALAGAIQVLTQQPNYPSRKYSTKIKSILNQLYKLEFNTNELSSLDLSLSILLSQFKKIDNLESLGVDIKSTQLFLFNYLIKYWEQFKYNLEKDNIGQLLTIKYISNSPNFKEVGKQSQLMGELMSWPFQLSNYFRLDKSELIQLVQLQLSKLYEFSDDLFNSWQSGINSDPLLLDKIGDPSDDSIRKSLRSILFSYVIIFKSMLTRPMTSTQVTDQELELMILSLFNLNFSIIIQIPRTIFKNHQDLLFYLFEQVENRKVRVKPLIERLLNEVEINIIPTELNSLNQLTQSKISFVLIAIEQLVAEIDNDLLEVVIEKLIKPFASEKFSWSLELYEASHSAALSIIQRSKVNCVPQFIKWYQTQLFSHFPGQMTGEQFRVAYTILVEGLSDQPNTFSDKIWKLYVELHEKSEDCLIKLDSNPEKLLESIGYINTYAALLPNTPSNYLNEYLARLEHLVKFFDKHPKITNNTVVALISLIKRMITENCDLGVKPYLVGWYLNLLNNLKLNENTPSLSLNNNQAST